MKIMLKDEYTEVTIERKLEGFGDLVSLFKDAALGLGYHPETVNNGFLEIAEDIELSMEKEEK